MKKGTTRLPVVSQEELFLADQEYKAGMLATKKPPKKGKKRFRLHW